MAKNGKIGISAERRASSKRMVYVGIFLGLSLIFLSLRGRFAYLGPVFSTIAIIITGYSYFSTKNESLKLRAKYMLLFVVLCVISYHASLGIANGNVTLLSSLGATLVEATSISAVFAGTIYEKVRSMAINSKHKLDRELIESMVRVATYPLLISIIAIFCSILSLMESINHFGLSIFLINITITFVLLTLISGVELLKEDLTRQLY